MTVLIFEPNLNGHRANYLKLTIDAFSEEGFKITVLSDSAISKHPLFLDTDSYKKKNVEFVNIKLGNTLSRFYGGNKLYNKELINIWVIRRYLNRTKGYNDIDLVFLPYIDHISRALGLLKNPFNGVRIMGISMTSTFHYHELGIINNKPKMAFLNEALFKRLLANQNVCQVMTIDKALVTYVGKNLSKYRQKISYLPDPVELFGSATREEARRYFDIPNGAQTILIYGALTERKGVVELLNASLHPDFPTNVCFLLAGMQTESLRNSIKEIHTRGHTVIVDRYITEDEGYMVFRCADIVWCGYKNFFGMSAVLIQAAAMGVPVIACNQGMINWVVQNYQIGISVDVFKDWQIINGIKKLLRNNETYRKLSVRGKKMAKSHSIKKFQISIATKASQYMK